MDKLPFHFHKDQRVRLRDGVDPNFYGGMSVTGGEGWIRKLTREEKFGFPKVYIEWDKDHWAYNGAQDTWTWEGHFETAGEIMAEDNEYEEFLAWKEFKKQQKNPPSQDIESSKESFDEEILGMIENKEDLGFLTTLEKAMNGLTEAEAFVVVAVQRKKHPSVPQGVLVPLIYKDALSPDAELVGNMQIPSLASELYYELSVKQLAKIFKEEDKDGNISEEG